MLVSSLRQVQGLLCLGEVFNRQIEQYSSNEEYWGVSRSIIPLNHLGAAGEQIIANRFARPDLMLKMLVLQATTQQIGFKITYDDLFDFLLRPHMLTECFLAAEGRFIHLKRRCLLAQYCSLKLAERDNLWIAYNEDELVRNQLPLTISVTELFSFFGSICAYEKAIDTLVIGSRHLSLYYEDLCDSSLGVQKLVGEHLGLMCDLESPQTLKQARKPLNEIIANLDEILSRVSQTPFASRCQQVKA